MLRTAEFWVAVSFVGFLAILVYYKIPALIAKALDERAAAIRKELDEARRLREEAQNLLNDYQKKHRNAGQEAEAITEQARREAEAYAKETRAALAEIARKAHQAGRGEDRPRGGPGGRRGAGSSRRHRAGCGRKDTARKGFRCSRRGPHRRQHPQSQRPAELREPLHACAAVIGQDVQSEAIMLRSAAVRLAQARRRRTAQIPIP